MCQFLWLALIFSHRLSVVLANDPAASDAQWKNLAALGPALKTANRNEYSEVIAKGALVYSGIAYKAGLSELAPCISGSKGHTTNFTVTKTVKTKIKDHTIGALAGYHESGYIVLAFEGTKSDWQLINEWSALDDVGFEGNTSLRVVSYWNSIATNQVENMTLALLELITKYPDAPVLFTGHSLGAATMTLCLAYMEFRQHIILPHDRLFIYTFGQPRAGGIHFARWYSSIFPQQMRVVHYDDVVPHVPCCILKGGKKCDDKTTSSFAPWHVSTEIWYDSKDMDHWEYCDGDPSGEDPSCAFSLHPWSYSVSDHLTYFDAHVGYMCEILEYKYPSRRLDTRRRAWTLICFW